MQIFEGGSEKCKFTANGFEKRVQRTELRTRLPESANKTRDVKDARAFQVHEGDDLLCASLCFCLWFHRTLASCSGPVPGLGVSIPSCKDAPATVDLTILREHLSFSLVPPSLPFTLLHQSKVKRRDGLEVCFRNFSVSNRLALAYENEMSG